mmetsp:Transcript_24238/g.67872  ORF Transcript_24238/g.67872 Transcript_24238/m.67872 type:complete len:232 (-) Transcript_24238:133-828(-)
MSQVRPSTGTADRKESLQITARRGAMDGRWPDDGGGVRGVAPPFMEACRALGARLLGMLEAQACPHLAPGTLAAAHTLWGGDGQCTLRMLHYPPVEARDVEGLPPDVWRAGPHTDWCCLTLLFQREGEPGLECAANPKAPAESVWVPVAPVPGGIAVNVGDLLGRWSNGRLLSNLHRVRMPRPEECRPPRSRYSVAFFMQADRSAVVESEGHEPITAGDYILGRIRSNFSG